MIKKWLAARRERTSAQLRQRGYDYAAGALLRGTDVHELSSDFDSPFDRNEFDEGGEQAIRDFYALTQGIAPKERKANGRRRPALHASRTDVDERGAGL